MIDFTVRITVTLSPGVDRIEATARDGWQTRILEHCAGLLLLSSGIIISLSEWPLSSHHIIFALLMFSVRGLQF
jgi:hypothetical protein